MIYELILFLLNFILGLGVIILLIIRADYYRQKSRELVLIKVKRDDDRLE